jgi:hypothetical protein
LLIKGIIRLFSYQRKNRICVKQASFTTHAQTPSGILCNYLACRMLVFIKAKWSFSERKLNIFSTVFIPSSYVLTILGLVG